MGFLTAPGHGCAGDGVIALECINHPGAQSRLRDNKMFSINAGHGKSSIIVKTKLCAGKIIDKVKAV